MTHMTDRLYLHECGGTILVGGHAEQRHSYCDRCHAFAYGDGTITRGTNEAANRQAFDDGKESSPEQ